MLSKSERWVFSVFRQFLMAPGEMLCVNRPNITRHRTAFRQLADKGFLVKEKFSGGYSLTQAGFAAMKSCK